MDQDLFNEIISVIKYLKEKKLIIELLKLRKLSKKQSNQLTNKDSKTSASKKIQTDCKLNNIYDLKYSPTLHQLIYNLIINEEKLKECLLITCKFNIPYLKVAALFLIFYKENDVKFLSAAVQTSRKMKFRKFSLLGGKILAKHCTDTYDEFLNLMRNDDYEFSGENDIVKE